MVSEIQYINIREVLSRLLKHPLMNDVTLELVILYTIDFIGIFGLPRMYEDKIAMVEIKDYRGLLPCDLISILQVRNTKCHHRECMRYMTDSFDGRHSHEDAFKTQGLIIYTSFREGNIEISYKAIPVDSEGLPLLPDNVIFMRALEGFIKKEYFGILFDMNKISQQVLLKAERDYSWKAGQLNSEYVIPSVSEMESISRMWNTLIPRSKEFDRGFLETGSREYLRLH